MAVQTDRSTMYAGISTSSYELECVDSSKFENNYISSATLIASTPMIFSKESYINMVYKVRSCPFI